MPKVESHIVRPFTREQIAAMLRACEAEELPWLVERDRTILYTLLDTGIRAEELCGLTLSNTHLTSDEPYIVVLGKGSKERAVGLGQTSQGAASVDSPLPARDDLAIRLRQQEDANANDPNGTRQATVPATRP